MAGSTSRKETRGGGGSDEIKRKGQNHSRDLQQEEERESNRLSWSLYGTRGCSSLARNHRTDPALSLVPQAAGECQGIVGGGTPEKMIKAKVIACYQYQNSFQTYPQYQSQIVLVLSDPIYLDWSSVQIYQFLDYI